MKFRSSLSVHNMHACEVYYLFFFSFDTVIVTKTVTVIATPVPTNIPDPSRQALCKYCHNIDLARSPKGG